MGTSTTSSARLRFQRQTRALAVIGVSAFLALFAGAAPVAEAHHAEPATAAPVRSCESLIELELSGKVVVSATSVAPAGDVPAHCNVQLTVTPPSGWSFRVGVFLPSESWNGRFVGIGGGGYSAGSPATACGRYVPCSLVAGYATAGTDAGTDGSGRFALNADNTYNEAAIESWNHLAIHETAVTAKQVITAFYGTGPAFSYFNGGSAGGRQAMTEAQRYPDDYDGIVANWPAINLARLLPAVLWPHVVMNVEGHAISQATFGAVNARVIEACDGLDGVIDRVIGNPDACEFDTSTLVGDVVTQLEAEIIERIWEGPRRPNGEFLWYGLPPGTPTTVTANTSVAPDGTVVLSPRSDALTWIQYWVLQDPTFDWRTITYESFADIFDLSVQKWEAEVGASSPDLSAFRDGGGKLVLTSPNFDTSIPSEGTVDYYERVMDELGGLHKVRKFARLFEIPGGGHETLIFLHPHPGYMPAGYAGAVPSEGSALAAVVDWVEHHRPPAELLGVGESGAGLTGMEQPLCEYPRVAVYKGHGDAGDADRYVCKKRFPFER